MDTIIENLLYCSTGVVTMGITWVMEPGDGVQSPSQILVAGRGVLSHMMEPGDGVQSPSQILVAGGVFYPT